MSDQKWTKEPWIYHIDPAPDGEMGYIYGTDKNGSNNLFILDLERATTGEANAARIVQCVNDCAGMVDPAATIGEKNDIISKMCTETRELRSQRDALLEAMHKIVNVAPYRGRQLASNAIAAVKENK